MAFCHYVNVQDDLLLCIQAAFFPAVNRVFSVSLVSGVPVITLVFGGDRHIRVFDSPDDFLEKVVGKVAEEGIEYWYAVPLEELAEGAVCADCGGTT